MIFSFFSACRVCVWDMIFTSLFYTQSRRLRPCTRWQCWALLPPLNRPFLWHLDRSQPWSPILSIGDLFTHFEPNFARLPEWVFVSVSFRCFEIAARSSVFRLFFAHLLFDRLFLLSFLFLELDMMAVMTESVNPVGIQSTVEHDDLECCLLLGFLQSKCRGFLVYFQLWVSLCHVPGTMQWLVWTCNQPKPCAFSWRTSSHSRKFCLFGTHFQCRNSWSAQH